MATIIIDPGHGGFEKIGGSSPNNATGAGGTKEKDLTLAIGLLLEASLVDLGHRVVMSRKTDVNLSLVERGKLARLHGADVFMSVHFNGFDDLSVQGTETWIHSRNGPEDRHLARSVQLELQKTTGYPDRGVKDGDLGVLDPTNHASTTAACLVEVSFITDPAGEERLKAHSYLDEVSKALTEGIALYLASRRPLVIATGSGVAEDGLSIGKATVAT